MRPTEAAASGIRLVGGSVHLCTSKDPTFLTGKEEGTKWKCRGEKSWGSSVLEEQRLALTGKALQVLRGLGPEESA